MKSNADQNNRPVDSIESGEESVCDQTEALDGLSPIEQQRLAEILDQYIQQIENGEAPDANKLLAEYPQWKSVLERYFESLGVLHHAAQGIHGSSPQITLPVSLTTDRKIGDYEIRRQIGRGGMGIVYEARQISLDRRVALKVLPLASVLDRRQIARFRREAQAAAQLHHPNIVPVFGVGCEEGIHFYSMQIVDGSSIDRVLKSIASDPDATRTLSAVSSVAPHSATIAEQHDSTIDQPVESLSDESHADQSDSDVSDLFDSPTSIADGSSVRNRNYIDRVAELGIEAANALQHAHDYGVIHRDIKPSNLMLDREGKLWVTDFGLAHIQSEADMTATGDLIGTLRYMSPEQASGTGVIDQRTDIYSLGITLYEMLTLKRAIPASERAKLLRDIEMLEPKGMRKINAAIPNDLETIILKSISKNRDLRYTCAKDFADDLQRYLDGKPILARRPTLIDLGTKWASRHRGIVASTLLLMTLALVGTSIQQARTERERQNVVHEKQNVELHRDAAIETLEQINEYARQLTKQPGIQHDIQRVTRELYRKFVAANEEGRPFIELAETHSRIASISEQLGDYEDAIDSFRSASDAYEELVVEDPVHRQAAALNLNNLGQVLTRVGEVDEAKRCYESALAALKSIDESNTEAEIEVSRGVALVVGNLGYLASNERNIDAAKQNFERAIQLRTEILKADPNNVDDLIRLAASYHNLSSLMVDTDLRQSAELCKKAIESQQEVVAKRPAEIEPRVDLALSWNNMGSIALRQKQHDLAAKYYSRAVRYNRTLAREAPTQPQLRHDLAISCNNLARVLVANGDLDAALETYGEAGQQFESLLKQFSDDPVTLARYGGTLYNQAIVYTRLRQSKSAKAAKLFERAIELQRSSVEFAPNPSRETYAELLTQSLSRYADFLARNGGHDRLYSIKNELATLRTRAAGEVSHAK